MLCERAAPHVPFYQPSSGNASAATGGGAQCDVLAYLPLSQVKCAFCRSLVWMACTSHASRTRARKGGVRPLRPPHNMHLWPSAMLSSAGEIFSGFCGWCVYGVFMIHVSVPSRTDGSFGAWLRPWRIVLI